MANSVGASVEAASSVEAEKCAKKQPIAEKVPTPQPQERETSVSEVKPDADSATVSGGVSADAVASAVASEEDDCVIVCPRDGDDRSDSGVSGVRSGGSASSVEEREWRAMAHGYGGGPPPPLLHLQPPPPALYAASELLWKPRYQPPLHAQLHHTIAEDYLNAATYDRERHERLLR